jgi:hypothetical protein
LMRRDEPVDVARLYNSLRTAIAAKRVPRNRPPIEIGVCYTKHAEARWGEPGYVAGGAGLWASGSAHERG